MNEHFIQLFTGGEKKSDSYGLENMVTAYV